MRDAVANAQAFVDYGCEIGEGFQLLPFWGVVLVHQGFKLVLVSPEVSVTAPYGGRCES